MIQATSLGKQTPRVGDWSPEAPEEMAAGIAENTTISFAGSSCLFKESKGLGFCLHVSWPGGRQGQRHQETAGCFRCSMWLRRKVVIIMDEVDGMGLAPRRISAPTMGC